MRYGNDQTRKIECARSANSGSSWNTAVNVDGIDNGDVDEFRASPVIAANSDRVVVFWAETNTESGSSSDQDIVYSSSNDDGNYGSFEYSTTITGDGSSKTFKAICSKNLAEQGG